MGNVKSGSAKATIIFLLFIMIVAVLYGSHKIVSDGLVYYAQTESLVQDFDFDLTNQRYLSHKWEEIGIRTFADPNRYGAFYPGGTALFNVPFLLIADVLQDTFKAIEEFNNNYLLLLREKILLSHSLAIFLGSLIYLFFSFFLIFKACYKQPEDSNYIIISILIIAISTSLLAHSIVYPCWSHIIDTFLITFAFLVFIKRKEIKLFNINFAYILIGLIGGMAAYVRSFDIIFLLPYTLYIVWEEGVKQRSFKKMVNHLILLAVGAAIPAGLILFYNNTQYGSPFKTGHFYNPSFFAAYYGGIKAMKLYLRNLLYYLINPVRGLIIYSPVVLLSFWGIFSKQAKKWMDGRFIAAFSILFALLGIANYNIFWAGGCFGQRFLTALFPFLVWGLLMFFQSVKRKKLFMLFAGMFCLYSFIIFNGYIIYWNSGESRDEVKLSKFGVRTSAYTPYDFIKVSTLAYKKEGLSLPSFLYNKIFLGNYRKQLFRFLFSKPSINAHYFLNTLEFAQKIPERGLHEFLDTSSDNFSVIHVIEEKKRAMRIKGYGSINYYLRIPESSQLSLFIKAAGEEEEQGNKKLKVTIQPQDSQEDFVLFKDSVSLLNYREWQIIERDLSSFIGKVAKVSFSIESNERVDSNNYLLISPSLIIPLTRAVDAKKMDYIRGLKLPKDRLRKTDIIVIAFNVLNADYLSSYVNHKNLTPSIDKFLREAVLFENAYSVASNNVASMASFFTSTYPLIHNLLDANHSLNPSVTTFAEILQYNHYQTYRSGFTLNSLNKGFQTKFSLPKSSQKQFRDKLHSFLGERNFPSNEKPSFIYILLRKPQSSNNEIGSFSNDSDETYYEGLLNNILHQLKEYGLYEDSIIILLANQGQILKKKNNRINYYKRNRIPLIIKFPNYFHIKPQRIKGVVESIDVMPTLLELLRIDDGDIYMQGKSMIPLIVKKESKIKECSLNMSRRAFVLTDLKYEFVVAHREQMLYNIEVDSKEEDNIADSFPILFHYYRTLGCYYGKQLKENKSKNRFDIRFDRKVEKDLGCLGYLK